VSVCKITNVGNVTIWDGLIFANNKRKCQLRCIRFQLIDAGVQEFDIFQTKQIFFVCNYITSYMLHVSFVKTYTLIHTSVNKAIDSAMASRPSLCVLFLLIKSGMLRSEMPPRAYAFFLSRWARNLLRNT